MTKPVEKVEDLGALLEQVWDQQEAYNDKVFERQQRSSAEWMETYILGLMSELGELLTAMRWKKHRLETVQQFGPNTWEEMADLTKYVFSMWQLLGYYPGQMLQAVYEKGEFLDKMYDQEFEPALTDKVVIFDLDDVLADLRGALTAHMGPHLAKTADAHELMADFKDWAASRELQECEESIHLDEQHQWNYEDYRNSKAEFEKSGGYRFLKPLFPLISLFDGLREKGWSIVVYTARPVNLFKTVKRDTYVWFREQDVMPDAIKFGREDRITYALQLKQQGKKVFLVEDNGQLIRRAQVNGIPCIGIAKPYNHGSFAGDYQLLISLLEGAQENDSDQ